LKSVGHTLALRKSLSLIGFKGGPSRGHLHLALEKQPNHRKTFGLLSHPGRFRRFERGGEKRRLTGREQFKLILFLKGGGYDE